MSEVHWDGVLGVSLTDLLIRDDSVVPFVILFLPSWFLTFFLVRLEDPVGITTCDNTFLYVCVP